YSSRGVEETGTGASAGHIQTHPDSVDPTAGNQGKTRMRDGELLHGAVRMVNAEDLLACRRDVRPHWCWRYANYRGLKAQQAIIVGGAIGEALPDHFLDFVDPRTVAGRLGPVAIRLVAEDDGA